MLSVLYVDDDAVVIDKPSGLAFQPGEGVTRSLVELAEQELGFKPYPVHRLDKDTSGCVLLARSPRAAARFAPLFEEKVRGVLKAYGAVVGGVMEKPFGVIEDDVRVRGVAKGALTRWRLDEALGDFSLLEVELGTGRMHQIRIHLASIGHPIVADDRHGDFAGNKAWAAAYGARRLMLWAARLELPVEPPIKVSAPPPPHVAAFLERLRNGTAPPAGPVPGEPA
ncbi:MAG: RNA pseudouridine synthase [Spirochaetales bacterium]|nr:RNA pseudouridine synthase [Spirochaetales bacterium]